MKIVFIAPSFHKDMGYIENCLPPHFAMEGHEVHILVSPLLPYYQLGAPEAVLGAFAGSSVRRPGDTDEYEGCTLHVLPCRMVMGRIYMKGMIRKLREIRPDVVQMTTCIGPVALTAAVARMSMRFALFTGNHHVFSTFPAAQRNLSWYHAERLRIWGTRTIHGRFIGQLTERCYAVTSDAAEVAWRFFGVPRNKVEVLHLGSDTRYFHPIRSRQEREVREGIRRDFGFEEEDIVCIFTGKMDNLRNPLLIARAVRELQQAGKPFKAIFVGAGPQRKGIEELGFPVLDFMPFRELGKYYRASDIGVWPGPESISQIDAAGCGLPLVIGDAGHYRDHVEGNGLVCKSGDHGDLVRTLSYLEDSEIRNSLGNSGARKIESSFSWKSISSKRLADYATALVAKR